MNSFFSTAPIWKTKGLAVVRIIVGLLIVYHGLEVFNTGIMNEYLSWDVFEGSSGKAMVYVGKSAELISGLSISLGLFTRVGGILIMGTLSYVTFFVGHGKFWYEDQHPFLFVLFGLLFVFTGPGEWSLDRMIFSGRTRQPGV